MIYTHARAHTHSHTHTHSLTHTLTHTHSHTHTHTHIHSHILTHTHTHTHTHAVELQIRHTKGVIENVPITQLGGARLQERYYTETDFWETLIHRKLKPVTVRFTQIDDLKATLKGLRNTVLAILLLVNLVWIILLYTLTIPQLVQYGLEPRAFQTVFLAVYGIIIIVQFMTILCHRAVTLVHYLGRTQPSEIVGPETEEPLVVSMDVTHHNHL